MILNEDKCDRITGFFLGSLRMGYSMDDAWKLMLNSKQGRGILNEDYEYCIHHQGIVSAEKADKDMGYKFKKGVSTEPNIDNLYALADFIEIAHGEFNLPYATMFNKYPIGKFFDECGVLLGNYDDKLIKRYLL